MEQNYGQISINPDIDHIRVALYINVVESAEIKQFCYQELNKSFC